MGPLRLGTRVRLTHAPAAPETTDLGAGPPGVDGFFAAPLRALREVPAGGVVFAGVPSEVTGMGDGTKFGPAAVRTASRLLSARWAAPGGVFDPRIGRYVRMRAPDARSDVGDLALSWHTVAASNAEIAELAEGLARTASLPVFVGGDHYITFPLFDGIARAGLAERIGYLQVDAHMDFDLTEAGEPHTHGTGARRLSELDSASIDRMAWVGIEDTHSVEAWECARDGGALVVTAAEVHARGPEAVAGEVIERLHDRCDAIYVSIDIDVLAAAHSPGTTYVNLLGLSPSELFGLLRSISTSERLIAADLVEVTPTRDQGIRLDRAGITAKLGAWALSELLGDRLIVSGEEARSPGAD
jgi:agmatinase